MPDVGMDIPGEGNRVWAEAELGWEEERIALTSRKLVAEALGKTDPDWCVLYIDDLKGDATGIADAIESRKERP